MRHDGNGNGTRRPDEILAEIGRTRGELDNTLSAIEHRLTPGQLVDQGLDYLRHSGGNEFVRNLGGSVKQNPLPVALVGIGLAWLMATNRKGGPQYGVSETSSSLGERASNAMEHVSGTAQAARERASQLGESARHLGESARQQMQRARSNVDYLVNEQPLALGAIGLAIGAVLAAAAPRTRQEDELMGEARERLARKAAETGTEKAKQAVETVKQAVSAEGGRHEPTARQPAGKPDSPASHGVTEQSFAPRGSTASLGATPQATPGNPSVPGEPGGDGQTRPSSGAYPASPATPRRPS